MYRSIVINGVVYTCQMFKNYCSKNDIDQNRGLLKIIPDIANLDFKDIFAKLDII